ncbi:MAG: hypothetical protein JETT_0463 [Candidatus Jettenia ecosi]|uniref:Uncharacterized protein n=1 Tax=Candidatus Jettenia ecosi TaxID=2494326 RepID=A0A533QF46_9BACT|nr:MAG: hypothetical protein JETT_0463 [Candidatus Jettenia ecosi]
MYLKKTGKIYYNTLVFFILQEDVPPQEDPFVLPEVHGTSSFDKKYFT